MKHPMKLRNSARGSFGKKVGEENRKKVIAFFIQNPDATLREASAALGLSRNTICIHARAVEAGK